MRLLSLILAASVVVPVAASAQTSASRTAPLDRDLLKMQVVLDRLGFSPGVLDGRHGMSLTAAIRVSRKVAACR